MSASEPLLSVTNLGIAASGTYTGTRQVLRNLDFTVQRGEVLAIIGQSGSGKTTLARAIVRLLPPNVTQVRGSMALNGRSIDRMGPGELRKMRRHEVNLVFQDPSAALNPTMTIGRQLFPPEAGRRRAPAKSDRYREALRLLESLGLENPEGCLAAYPFELSGGMKQRILIASSLLAGPSLIIADEPTSALDPVLRNSVLRMFLKLTRERGTAVVLITHDLPLTGSYADRMLMLRDGTMAESGTPGDLPDTPFDAVAGGVPLPRRPQRRNGPRENDVVLRVSGLSVDMPVRGDRFWKSRRYRRILDDIHLEVARGEIVGLLGASGAGKSTLGRCILGLIEPTSGTINIGGHVRGSMPQPRRNNFATAAQVIYQNPYSSLSPKLTVRSIVLEPLRTVPGIDRTEREARFTRVMSDVGLGLEFAERLPHEMSGGQRQRVAIARALIGRPRLVVADEPVSSLDTVACQQVLELIDRLRGSYGFACVLISHDLGALRAIADRIAVMEKGRIVETDTAERIFDSPAHPCTAGFVSAAWPTRAIPR